MIESSRKRNCPFVGGGCEILYKGAVGNVMEMWCDYFRYLTYLYKDMGRSPMLFLSRLNVQSLMNIWLSYRYGNRMSTGHLRFS